MSQASIALIVQKVVREVAGQWEQFKEPVSMVMVSARINDALIRHMGMGWDATRFCRELERQKILHIVRTRSGKHWVFLFDSWSALTADERDEWNKRLVFMSDAVEEKMNFKRLQRLKDSLK